ncbi:hypothetical protein [Actinokineospora globicatena]|uniref:hypothetical protein n=1 Tax=Actinokineospora globicatena TaxID=103729 RepID=UPI0020A401F5|nr:hypothetical protein [Actinokineospora globicatena]MCP2303868.1 hypothetical protein [Actinokineospora globicatena]GLW78974.1 hypothetical protein Aglo01_34560 [Actinokineospora globicatena]GLW86615.1 hypothetical protein Aglo02_42540 [Actinokineospora globicatena]
MAKASRTTRAAILGVVVLSAAIAGVLAALAGATPGWAYVVIAILAVLAGAIVARKGWLNRNT